MQGFLTCKDRHIKCDEGKPVCQNCINVNRECVQRDGSRALASSMNGNMTAIETPNTPPIELLGTTTTIINLSVVPEGGNTSESAKTANTDSNPNSKPLGKYKESGIDSIDQDRNINKLTRSIKKLRYPQDTIMTQKTSTSPKSPVPAMGSDKKTPNSTTTSKPNDMDINNNNKQTSTPTPGVKLISSLSLASTTTNRPAPSNFTPLKPITHWVPPRPTIAPRTSLSGIEKAELVAEDAARKTEKQAVKVQKEKEVERMVVRAKEVQMEIRARELSGYRDCWFGTCGESVAGSKCKPY